MSLYRAELGEIEDTLSLFVKDRKIDATKLNIMDEVINKSKSDQFKIINDGRLNLKEQRILFDGARNVNLSLIICKKKLEEAYIRHENPTIAELALELMPFTVTVGQFLDIYFLRGIKPNFTKLATFSRALYKKANHLNFYQDSESQLSETTISKKDIESFIQKFNESLSTELELQEENEFSDSDNDRDVSSG